MDTNPVVIRRIMGGLRDQGYVRSEKGHGGGWTLACDPSKVTLRDVYAALGSPSLLAIGNRTEAPDCLVEEAVNAALDKSFQDAEALLLSRLGKVTLARLSADVRGRLAARGRSRHAGAGPWVSALDSGRSRPAPFSLPQASSPAARRAATISIWAATITGIRAPTITGIRAPVADVGAGTGYFAVRLARAVPAGEVIATDLEPDMVRYERARREQLPNLRAIRATPTASGLAARSVDRIVVVHVWHHLADRVAYARDLSAALRPGGKLFVVDFSLTSPRGPPANLRLAPEAIIAELAEAGLAAKLSPVALPDQYLEEASRGPWPRQQQSN